MSYLAPQFLTQYIQVYAFILGAVVLVIFSDALNKHLVFPVAHSVRHSAKTKIRSMGSTSGWNTVAEFGSEALATGIFILYCWLGSYVLAEFIFAPILYKFEQYTVIVLIILFSIISYIINNESVRRTFLKF